MIRITAKLFVFTVGVAALNIASASAVTYLASNGSGSSCTFSQPCSVLLSAIEEAGVGGEILCFTPTTINNPGTTSFSDDVTIDCSGVMQTANQNVTTLQLTGNNQEVKIRNLTIFGMSGGSSVLKVTGSGLLILENFVIDDYAGIALDIEPNGPLNLVIKNSRISNNTGAGVLIKPAAGGSVTATFDGVTIVNNAGGLKTDSTNGAVRVDISNSTISNNANNGLIAIGGAGGQNMVTVKNDVIASNGQAGIEASGATAAVLVNNAVLDSNTGGSLQAVSSGRILTYQTNTVIGALGTGFTGTTAPQ
jgi:hypothetical protein